MRDDNVVEGRMRMSIVRFFAFMPRRTMKFLNEVEKEFVFEEFETLDDVFVLYEMKYQDFYGDSTIDLVLHPRLLWDLFFNDKFDSDLNVLLAVDRGHYKTISTGAEFIAKAVIMNKGLEEPVVLRKSRGVVTAQKRCWMKSRDRCSW